MAVLQVLEDPGRVRKAKKYWAQELLEAISDRRVEFEMHEFFKRHPIPNTNRSSYDQAGPTPDEACDMVQLLVLAKQPRRGAFVLEMRIHTHRLEDTVDVFFGLYSQRFHLSHGLFRTD
ncbi:hypothetical protein L226DRAFT_567131 [Lentinus tigrinus ALCF2SS1-7]|uniref:Uncharacterized protein n=1 Tax=Lentinus tigrinus ALCF2SS1-6 TaxID=1328759 RepID=A0A5C2SQ93_9APHY|nr:hypothetical protein L227DRAFT_631310 [Lentinus tigrinus ALCF2SS1-6]RPD78931.1 hypothetical protein L226DRAFT_567131 [Lentinus tigrinus ALCF2SS1-7]